MRWRTMCVLGILVLTGCSPAELTIVDTTNDPDETPIPSEQTSPSPSPVSTPLAAPDDPWPLAVFDYEDWVVQPGWDLQQAVYPLAGGWTAIPLMETMEWFNEYNRLVDIGGGVRQGFNVNVAGHSVGFDHFRTLPIYADLTATEPINNRESLSMIGPDADGYVTIMMKIDDGFTLVVGAGDMTLGEVREIAGRMRLVGSDQWESHGGRFIECVWSPPDCDAIPPEYQTTTTTARPIAELTTTTLGPD